MRLTAIRSVFALLALGGLTLGCGGDNGGTDAGVDSGPAPDAGCPSLPELPTDVRPEPTAVTCPATDTPAPEEQMGTCCWRHSNAAQPETPEMRLQYIKIIAPIGSTLTSSILGTVLNRAMQEQTFNWLFRVEGAETDGPVTIVTGFGRRQADGTYQFSSGTGTDPATWCPVSIDATLTGETLTSSPIEGAITVPVFDSTGTTVQIELILRNIAIDESTWGEDRSCVGWKTSRPYIYRPDAILSAFIEVEASRTGAITVPPVDTTLCAAIAGENLGDADYCDTTPQGEWTTPPDSLCDATGCLANAPCASDVCDPATTCNAWRVVAQFAAAGVDITNNVCP